MTGVATPTASPRADMGTRPHGTSSVTYLWLIDRGVGVHWYGPVGAKVRRWNVSARVSPPSR